MSNCWIEPDIRDEIIDFVKIKKQDCNISAGKLLSLIGISHKRFCNWKQSYGSSWNYKNNLPKSHYLQEWEKDKIVKFYLEHEGDGYRRCAYMMIDQDIVHVAPSTVYSVLKKRGVIRTRNVKVSKKGTGFKQPLKAHQHWHSDITNVAIGDTVYFLISIIDGYSRSVIAWDLRDSMKTQDVAIVFQKAKELYPEAKPRFITDNGKQYKCREFKRFVTQHGYTHVTTSPYYPQSNGKQERFHGSLKSECIRVKCPLNKKDALNTIEEYIDYYNNKRLHSAIGYISPKDKLNGQEQAIWNNRDIKLKKRRLERKDMNKVS